MKNACIIIFICIPTLLFSQLSSVNYQTIDKGSFTTGGYTSSTNYQNFIVNTWYSNSEVSSMSYSGNSSMPSGFVFVFCDEININALGPTLFCKGDSVILDAGVGFSSYQWSSGGLDQTIIVKDSGSYNVMVIDSHGCLAGSDTITVSLWSLPEPIILGVSDFCNGDTISLNAGSGHSGYEWNTGSLDQIIHVFESDTLFVDVADGNGCIGRSDTVIVSALENPIPTISQAGDSLMTGNFNSYQWFLNNVTISGANEQSYEAVETGNYTVEVEDNNGCIGISGSFFLEITSIKQQTKLELLSVFPNPTDHSITISGRSDKGQYLSFKIQSVLGKDLIHKHLEDIQSEFMLSIDLQELSSGNYILLIYNDHELIETTRIVKK